VNVRLRRRGPLALLLVGAALGVLVGAGGLVVARTHVTRMRYQLMELQSAALELRGEVEKLSIEAAALGAPDRLEREARRLGLQYPEPGQVLLVHPEPGPTRLAAAGARP
jgi:cell division protein FtsL